ncbi:type II toxin-antitoxin system HicB family antitoxin [Fundidesulfovibrio putealis]|uniref:type II toxin-antitoxin system HicB family antitoxin n=1 Tax=Fundidesulfovibrio putealis TaxID=270496 RepID=UPI000412117E|nr:type II toxin-antitoxin system HicB family antitoxin [Fundidesulfovibrio putealis]
MFFPAAIFIEEGKAYGVTLPDIPGCNTAGDTLEEALGNVQEAVELLLEDASRKPASAGLEAYKDDPLYKDAVWAMVNVDLGFLDERTVRVNVSFPAGTLEEIDKAAKGRGLTRSAFLTRAARHEMASM